MQSPGIGKRQKKVSHAERLRLLKRGIVRAAIQYRNAVRRRDVAAPMLSAMLIERVDAYVDCAGETDDGGR